MRTFGGEQGVEEDPVGHPEVDEGAVVAIGPLHVELDQHPLPAELSPGERRRLGPVALPSAGDLRGVDANQACPASASGAVDLPGTDAVDDHGVSVDDADHLGFRRLSGRGGGPQRDCGRMG